MTGRVLVAGIGNVFLGDDGFGVEVVRRIDPAALPDGVDVSDYGIRGVHLAYDLLDAGYETLVLVDAVPGDDPPGTLTLLEGDDTPLSDLTAADGLDGAVVEAHSMSPDVVLSVLRGLGGAIPRVLVVGCRPLAVAPGMALSAPVAAAVDRAVGMVTDLAASIQVPAEVG